MGLSVNSVGVLVGLFGAGNRRLPRVAVLEAFVENPDIELSAPEVEKIADVSRRAAYYIIKGFAEEGILVRKTKVGKTQLYALNQNDVRTDPLVYLERLLTIGRLEAEMKREEGIDQSDMLDESILPELRSPPRRMDTSAIGFDTIRPDLATALIPSGPNVRSSPGFGPFLVRPYESQPLAATSAQIQPLSASPTGWSAM
jgi:hypothetical protein